ncbi:MAG: hypothetical protein J5I98_09750 [Phaeodactylibacter sp.]|nr:hypothetical protein [Phaeodactylibacter sp.]
MFKSKLASTLLLVLFCVVFQNCTKEDAVEMVTTVFDNVVWENDTNPKFKTVELAVPSITQEIVDNGAVFIYGSNDGQLWDVLPKSVNNQSLWFEYKINHVRVLFHSPDETFEQYSEYTHLKVITVSSR